MKKLEHIPTLDGLRAIAILMVVVYHYFFAIVSPEFINIYFRVYTSWWWAGVDLFFVLSGFLIGRILINVKESENYFKVFYTRRFFRIFPAYYLILGLLILFLLTPFDSLLPWLTEPLHPLYSYALYIQNFFQGAAHDTGARWLGVTWSLAIEEQFYLILPLIIFFLPTRFIPALCLVGIVAAPIVRYSFDDLNAYVLLPSRMDSLLTGVFLGWLHLQGKAKIKYQYLLTFSLVVLVIIQLLVNRSDFEKTGGVLNHSMLAVFFGAVLLMAINAKGILEKALTIKPLIHIGRISYMMYLTHQIFNGLFHGFYKNGAAPSIENITDVTLTLLAFATCVIFCTLSFIYFEKPIINIGHRFNFKPKE